MLFPHAWVDGRIVPLHRPVLRSDDRALLFGLGAFETVRVYSGVPFDLGPHLARMRQTLRALGLDVRELTEPRLRGAIASLYRANDIRGDVAVRITRTGGPEGGRGSWIVQARTLDPAPDRLRARGARLVTAPWRRVPAGPLRRHKTLNYLEHFLARAHARRREADEAIYVDSRGRILEGSFSSIFVVRRGRVATPSLASGILPGITRARVCRIIRSLGIPLRERPVTRQEFVEADEAFLTSSSNEVVPIDRLDGRRLRRGTLWRCVWEKYRAQVERELHRREGRR